MQPGHDQIAKNSTSTDLNKKGKKEVGFPHNIRSMRNPEQNLGTFWSRPTVWGNCPRAKGKWLGLQEGAEKLCPLTVEQRRKECTVDK